MKKNNETSCNCFKWAGGVEGGDGGGNLTDVQGKAIWNCHNESLLYNEHMLIKITKKNKQKEKVRQIQ
jgi:hypothetical protein